VLIKRIMLLLTVVLVLAVMVLANAIPALAEQPPNPGGDGVGPPGEGRLGCPVMGTGFRIIAKLPGQPVDYELTSQTSGNTAPFETSVADLCTPSPVDRPVEPE
jgi:hypothetical protein